LKVLVVDDSVVFRMAISQALSEVPGISNPKTVSNGQLAIQHLKNFPDTDLITLDLEMPVMDGIQTIKEIRKFNRKVIIIVFSSLSVKGAEKTLEALTSGANDFVTKQEAGGATSIDASLGMIRELLLPKVSAFSKRQNSEPIAQETLKTKTEDLISMTIKPRLIVIGSSTGGPEALSTIFKGLNVRANIPILIVQHMPPIFTDKLAQMLNNLTPYAEVREAKVGDELAPGVAYIAPGDFHMTLEQGGMIKLNQDPKVCFVRPSVNVLLESVAKNFKEQLACFILTGMGDDGAEGCKKLPAAKTYQFVQSKDTSVVWGMPGATLQAIPSAKILHLNDVSSILNNIFNRI